MIDENATGRRWKTLRIGRDRDPEPESVEPERPTGTFLGSGASFEGTLHLQGDFRIDVAFRGELKTDGTLTVGESGSVEGAIHAREVEIYGAVVGNVFARRLLVLNSGARLYGDIETACLEVQRHAFFQGATVMTRPQASSLAASHHPVVSPASTGPARLSSSRQR